MWFSKTDKNALVAENQALEGREDAIKTASTHHVFGIDLQQPLQENEKVIIVGMGCFWGAERRFWQLEGVVNTSVGYSAGFTPNPTYEEVCSGKTGHNEVVRVVYNAAIVSLEQVLATFWQAHNPTQGMGQGNDRGTQYRSGIYVNNEAEVTLAEHMRQKYQSELDKAGFPSITTEIALSGPYYYAEAYHQQYLSKNPGGYCGLGGTGVPAFT